MIFLADNNNPAIRVLFYTESRDCRSQNRFTSVERKVLWGAAIAKEVFWKEASCGFGIATELLIFGELAGCFGSGIIDVDPSMQIFTF
jgi:hypothetical protein